MPAKKVAETQINETTPAFKFKVKKLITVPQLKMDQHAPVYVKITSKIETSDVIQEGRKPAEVCDVIDLSTGQEHRLIIASVIMANMEKSYPNDAYVNKSFMFEKLDKP